MERSEMEKNLEQLKSSLASGELTGSELVRRLQVMIHNELTKPEEEVDIEFIEACSSLIERIYPKIAERPEGYYEEQEAKFKLRLKQEEKALRHRRVLRPVIAIAAVLIIAFLGIGSIQFRWFTRESTPDQQQLIIQGHEVSVDMVEKAIAEHLEEGYFETNNINELGAFLNFPLEHLDLHEHGWDISNSWTYLQESSIETSILYVNGEDKSMEIWYDIVWFIDVENAIVSIEQNESGFDKNIAGKKIHYLRNCSQNSYVWIDNMVLHNVRSLLSEQEIEEFIKNLLRSD